VVVGQSGSTVRLSVGGGRTPDEACLESAVAVHERLSSFLSELGEYLEGEAGRQEAAASEIRALKCSEIAYWWVKKPDHAMLFFDGPSEERQWHCDYVKSQFTGLVYDG